MDSIEALRMRGFGGTKRFVGDAQSSDVRAGKTFTNALGNDKVGQLNAWATDAQTITPGTADIIKPAGIYDGNITVQGDPDLIAQNIISGKSIFGVVGMYTGRQAASGQIATIAGTGDGETSSIAVSGLAFTPTMIIAAAVGSTGGTSGNATTTTFYWSMIASGGKAYYYTTSSPIDGTYKSGIVYTAEGNQNYVIQGKFRIPSSLSVGTQVNWLAIA